MKHHLLINHAINGILPLLKLRKSTLVTYVLLGFALLGIICPLTAQSPIFGDYLLEERTDAERQVVPTQARYYEIDAQALRDYLHAAPWQGDISKHTNPDYIFELPDPQGQLTRFRIVRYQMMEKGLMVVVPGLST